MRAGDEDEDEKMRSRQIQLLPFLYILVNGRKLFSNMPTSTTSTQDAMLYK